MVHQDVNERPAASTLVHHPCICPDANKSKAQLRKELNQEKFKNEMLQRKVRKYEQQISKIGTDSPLAISHHHPSICDTPNNTHQRTPLHNPSTSLLTSQLANSNSKCVNSKFTRSLSSSTIL